MGNCDIRSILSSMKSFSTSTKVENIPVPDSFKPIFVHFAKINNMNEVGDILHQYEVNPKFIKLSRSSAELKSFLLQVVSYCKYIGIFKEPTNADSIHAKCVDLMKIADKKVDDIRAMEIAIENLEKEKNIELQKLAGAKEELKLIVEQKEAIQAKVDKNRQLIEEYERLTADQKKEIARINVESRKTILQEKNKEILQLKKQVKTKETIIEEQNNEIQNLQSQLLTIQETSERTQLSYFQGVQERFKYETRKLVEENRMLKSNIDKLVDQITELKRKK